MKKILLILMVAFVPLFSQAQGFRTFLDLHAGRALSAAGGEYRTDADVVSNVKPALTFGLNITEGYQITPNLFAGIGFAGYASFLSFDYDDYGYNEVETTFYSLYFPFYADVRWNFFPGRSITPYADVKIGYQIGVKVSEGELTWRSNDNICAVHKNGVYFVPSVGVRFGKASGFNLGIAYNTSIGMKFIRKSTDNGIPTRTVLDSASTGAIMLTFGADF